MSAAAVLKGTFETIRQQSSFISTRIAVDRRGNGVSFDSEHAVRFDVVGAMLRQKSTTNDFAMAAMIVRGEVGAIGVFEYEERFGHKAVLKMLNRAISAAEARQ